MRFVILFVCVLALSACRTTPGAGATQNPCGLAEVKASAPNGGTAQAQAQSLQTGQRASNQPTMTDPAKWAPGTTWGGGAGAVDAANSWIEERSQSGAPSVNQGLLFPASQEQEQTAGNCGAMPHPQIMALDRQIKNCEGRLMLALSKGDVNQADKEREHLTNLNEQYALASANTAKTVNNNYHFDGALITQGVSSSSTASGEPGTAKTGDEGTSATAEEIVKAAGAPLPSIVPAVGTVIRVPTGTVPEAPESSPETPEEPE